MQRYLLSVATGSLALAFVGCNNEGLMIQDQGKDKPVQVSQTQQGMTAIGDPLPGTDPDKFAEAKANFAAEEAPWRTQLRPGRSGYRHCR